MDLGLGNLISLKRHLLAKDIQSRSDWDTMIADIGRGVANHFENYCNRKWARTVGETDEFSSDRRSWVLRRYPVEAITALDQRTDLASGWVTMGAVNSVLLNWDADSGLVEFGAVQGEATARIRITYTGGYWFDTAETEDTVQPIGSTLVPYQLREAWFLQCEKIWQVIDPLGTGVTQGGSTTQLVGLSLAGLELIPQVKQLLQPEKRFCIT